MSEPEQPTCRIGTAIEVEFKMLASPEVLSAIAGGTLLRQYTNNAQEPRELVNYYFDTPGSALKKAGYTLRVRWDGECWIQCLKVRKNAVDGLFRREEWERPVNSGVPDVTALPDGPTFEAVREAFATISRVFVTRFQRTTYEVAFTQPPSKAPTILTMSLDVGRIETPDRSTPLAEVELELAAGPEAGLFEFARILQAAYPLSPGNQSKADRGYSLIKSPAMNYRNAAP